MEGSKGVDIIFVGQTGVGKSSLINMVLGKEDTATDAAKVSNDTFACTQESNAYPLILEGLQCRLWDTRGLGEAVYGRSFLAKLLDQIHKMASSQASELKKFLRERTQLATPILLWCMDASKIEVQLPWEQFFKVYAEYCSKDVIPAIVVNQMTSSLSGLEDRCHPYLNKLGLDEQPKLVGVRKHRGAPFKEDAEALRDLISDLMRKSTNR